MFPAVFQPALRVPGEELPGALFPGVFDDRMGRPLFTTEMPFILPRFRHMKNRLPQGQTVFSQIRYYRELRDIVSIRFFSIWAACARVASP